MELRLGLELGDRRVVEKIRKQNNRYAFVSFNIGHALLKNKDDQWVISYESNDFTYIEWLYTALSSWIIDESYLQIGFIDIDESYLKGAEVVNDYSC